MIWSRKKEMGKKKSQSHGNTGMTYNVNPLFVSFLSTLGAQSSVKQSDIKTRDRSV